MEDNTIHPTHTTRSNTLDALDCVSRQVVTDLVHLTILEFMDICADSEEEPMTEKNKLLLEVNKKICTRIKELPSAQFDKDITVPDKNVGKIGDLIDRQAAIDALSEWLYDQSDERLIDEVLLNVPSTQPKIIHCRECKWWGYDDDDGAVRVCHAAKHGFMSSHWDIQIYRTYRGDFWCADAERREDE